MRLFWLTAQNTCFAKLLEGTSGRFCVWGFLGPLRVIFKQREKKICWLLNTNNKFTSWITSYVNKCIIDSQGKPCFQMVQLNSLHLLCDRCYFHCTQLGSLTNLDSELFSDSKGCINISPNPFKWSSGFGQGSHYSNLQVWPILTYKFPMTGPLLISGSPPVQ